MTSPSPRPLALLTLAAALLMAGCGDDEDEAPLGDTQTRPAPRQPVVDTSLGDTLMAGPGGERGTEGGTPGRAGPAGPGGPDAAAPGASSGDTRGAGGAGGETADAAGAATTGSEDRSGATGSGRSYTVQVGAFNNPETARYWEERLATQGMPVWISMAEVQGRTFYRLRIGAVQSVDDARTLGAIIADRYEWPVWLAPLTPADRPPAGARERTERLLRSG